MVDIVIPALGESVSEAIIAKWYKKAGDSVSKDELLLELETDKVTLEVNAKEAGTLEEVLKNEGQTVKIGEIVGRIKEGQVDNTPQTDSIKTKASKSQEIATSEIPTLDNTNSSVVTAPVNNTEATSDIQNTSSNNVSSPSATKIAKENNIDVKNVKGTGKEGRITKGDVLEMLPKNSNQSSNQSLFQSSSDNVIPFTRTQINNLNEEGEVKIVKMSRLRLKIAERLKESQNTAAILTTFNEVDMTNVIEMRNKYKEEFEKKYGVKLGFMSFFVKACIGALKDIPEINAEISGENIIYRNYCNIGVAVGTDQGLVVPVVNNADKLNFADIEISIANLGKKAREGKITVADLSNGTFTISNGGIYGSLLSTPIINPPQSGILGMHKIQERPVAIDGRVEIRPMMYLALSYDHRIVDGKEAVTFLIKVKEAIENPEKMLLDI